MTTTTADAWRGTALAVGYGRFYGQLAVPTASARITLHTDNTPDAVTNTSAFHFGVTDKGAKLSVKVTYDDFMADEFKSPIYTAVNKTEMKIALTLLAVTDMDVVKNVLTGVGTYSTAAGYKQITMGSLAIAMQCVAHIFPLVEDTTKVGVFMLYNAMNKAGVEWDQSRTTRGGIPVEFMGYDVTTRATADTTGNYWKQI